MTNSEFEELMITTLIENEKLLLPFEGAVSIEKIESPDYCLCRGSYKIGVEITRAMDENLNKACVERNKLDKSIPFSPTLFENEKMSSKEIKKGLNKSREKLIGRPYKGDDLEKLVFSNIKNSIDKKILKFESYRKFEENWIYVYHDNRVSLEIESVVDRVSQYIETVDIMFDILLLKLGDSFYKFDGSGLITLSE